MKGSDITAYLTTLHLRLASTPTPVGASRMILRDAPFAFRTGLRNRTEQADFSFPFLSPACHSERM